MRIREKEGDLDMVMEAAPTIGKPLTWNDRSLGTGLRAATTDVFQEDGDFEFSEADVVRSLINGIPSIEFSERVNQILTKSNLK